jgi:hypothetical protein
MDYSSPAAFPSSLPPSSAPNGTNSQGTPRRQARPAADALAIDDASDGPRGEDSQASRRRPRIGRGMNGDVPVVHDAVGESVVEVFETFLKT